MTSNRDRIGAELQSMNDAIVRADALRTLPDGFTYVDASAMGSRFMALYASLSSAAVALGAA